MWNSRVFFAALLAWGVVSFATAQPILPALVQATSVDAAMQVIGAGKPVPSGHLRLEFDDIVTPGPLQVRVESLLPGTVAMVLLSGAPALGASGNATPTAARPSFSPPGPTPTQRPGAVPELQPGYIQAWPVAAGTAARFQHRIPQVSRGQAFTLLVQAQGRWYIVVRELKIARPARSK